MHSKAVFVGYALLQRYVFPAYPTELGYFRIWRKDRSEEFCRNKVNLFGLQQSRVCHQPSNSLKTFAVSAVSFKLGQQKTEFVTEGEPQRIVV